MSAPRKHNMPNELINSLLSNYKKLRDLIGENGLLKQLTKLLRPSDKDAAGELGPLSVRTTAQIPPEAGSLIRQARHAGATAPPWSMAMSMHSWPKGGEGVDKKTASVIHPSMTLLQKQG
jgi:hypothetical protein